MKLLCLFTLFLFLLTQCKPSAHYKFKPSFSVGTEPHQTTPDNSFTTATDPADSTSRYFKNSPEEQPVFDAKKPKPKLLTSKVVNDTSIQAVAPEVIFADSSQAVINKKPPLKPNAMAHVSFFSGVALLLLYLFPYYIPVLSLMLGILLPISAIITGKIAIRQMAKRNESGRALAIFGMVVGSLAFLLALLLFLYLLGVNDKADSFVP